MTIGWVKEDSDLDGSTDAHELRNSAFQHEQSLPADHGLRGLMPESAFRLLVRGSMRAPMERGHRSLFIDHGLGLLDHLSHGFLAAIES